MLPPPDLWTPFASPDERLQYLKDHKLTPKSFSAPKELFYCGTETAGERVPCSPEGFVDRSTMVIRVAGQLHCIHPDYLLEMQSRRAAPRRNPKPPKSAPPPDPGFVAIDFETATSSFDSACSLGIALVENLEVTQTWYHLLQPPQNHYEEANIRIHGITPDQTANQPVLAQLWPEIRHFFLGRTVVAHNARFDISVLRAVLPMSDDVPNFLYADTLRIVRGIVPGRHGLDACCEFFHIPLEHHHNALDDAIACARVAVACIRHAGDLTLTSHLRKRGIGTLRFRQNLNPPSAYIKKNVRVSTISPTVSDFDPNHPLYQKVVVFTGDLSIDRAAAMQRAVNKGAVVRTSVSSKTNVLVMGTRHPDEVPSTKERRAHELIQSGRAVIQFMDQETFLALTD